MLTDFLIFVAPFIIIIMALILAFLVAFKDESVTNKEK
ncbi:cytochrome bd oxidase small subunit CydS [Oceanobacillus sp. FSL K6-0118]